MALLFIDLVPSNRDSFAAKVESISKQLGINPDWLMLAMKLETANSFSAAKTNSIGATGLIQFIPTTAKGLGTSTAELSQMTEVKQLDYVYKYLQPFAGKMKNFYDVYFVIFWNDIISNKPDSYKVSSAAAKANPGFDLNKDGTVTVSEIKQYLQNFVKQNVPANKLSDFNKQKSTTMDKVKNSLLATAALLVVIYFVIQIAGK